LEIYRDKIVNRIIFELRQVNTVVVQQWVNVKLVYSLGGNHPTIWKCIDGIKKIQNLEELKREQYNAGEQPRKKKYKDCA
jgi:hypothetical protein